MSGMTTPSAGFRPRGPRENMRKPGLAPLTPPSMYPRNISSIPQIPPPRGAPPLAAHGPRPPPPQVFPPQGAPPQTYPPQGFPPLGCPPQAFNGTPRLSTEIGPPQMPAPSMGPLMSLDGYMSSRSAPDYCQNEYVAEEYFYDGDRFPLPPDGYHNNSRGVERNRFALDAPPMYWNRR
eukprot:GHVL01040111.1.p1 GENE.GHVL01040111.1~~GHVL01040111.1.p1  ORF type:complete len:178 (+),score=41.76 GHVL01040111.1:69-602(+)